MKPLGVNDPVSIGPYRLLGLLGRGGMGRVFLAESRTGRRVAVKVIHADLAEDPMFRRRFEREVSAARTVNPLYTAAVVDADTAATEPWFATTFIDGTSLSKLVAARGPLAASAVLTLAAGLAEGLASIHEAGLVHRDVSPGNIILDDTGPHIIDFGIAITPHTTRLTAGMVMGTPSYIAPEVIQGGEAGPPGDVFGLGATLAFAATGKHLITDGPLHAQIAQITLGRFDLDAVPRQVRPLVVRCTSADPRDRPTAPELVRILVASGVAAPSPGWYTGTAPAPPVRLPRSRSEGLARRRVLVIGGVAGAAAVGTAVAAWAGLSEGRQPDLTTVTSPRTGSPSSTTSPPATPPRPGDVLWQARSGARPVGLSPSVLQSPTRIIVDRGEQLITANGSEVYAVDLNGALRWSENLQTGLVNLWPWGDAVLVSDARQLWLLDAATGEQRFVVDAAGAEERDSRGDNPDNLAIEIRGVALSADRAFVGLGTASVAYDRSGGRVWRRARPDPRNGVRPPAGVPVATSDRWLVTHDPAGALVELGLRDIDNGELQWLVQYEPVAQAPPPPPRGGRAGPPGPGPGPGGDDTRSEGRIGAAHVVIREAQEIRVVDLASGRTVWTGASQTPVMGMDLVGDMVLMGADLLRAYRVATGALLWESDERGARVGISPSGRQVIAAGEVGLSAVDLGGSRLWSRPYPDVVRDAAADRVSVMDDRAYVTFRAKGNQRDPLEVDVLAIALGPDA